MDLLAASYSQQLRRNRLSNFDALDLGMSSSAILFGTDKIVRARVSNGHFNSGQNIADSQLWSLSKTNPSGQYSQTSLVDGNRRDYYYNRVKGFPLYTVIGISESDLSLQVAGARQANYLAAGATSLMVLSLIFFGYRQAAAHEKMMRTTDALRESEAQLRLIANTMPAHVSYKDREGNILFANQAYAERHGFNVDEIIGQPREKVWRGLNRKDTLKEIAETLEGKITQSEGRDELRKDEERYIMVTRAPHRDKTCKIIGYITVGQDITDRRNMEAALLQSQKMEAVGQLTGGVAHDFNNLMAVIMGNAQLMAATSDSHQEEIAAIVCATKRGAELTQRLLAFSRRQALQPRTVDLTKLVDGMLGILTRTLGETIQIENTFNAGLAAVTVDPGQLENVILNLAINARDAMPNGGKLSIELSRDSISDDLAEQHDDIKPGEYVVLAVSDNGEGMSEETRAHAIEPFFTTKDVGDGSGLGLSMAYGFAHQSGGDLAIYSEPGFGTTITISLPLADGPAQADDLSAEITPALPRAQGGTVLVVEDDPDVRQLSISLLTNLGYKVIDAGDAAAALSHFENTSKIDLLLSDVVLLGEASGFDLAKIVMDRWPKIKILFMSGYPAQAASQSDMPELDGELLSKPFTRGTLARKLREILDA
jgi:PAS domain S-box-containing protein